MGRAALSKKNQAAVYRKMMAVRSRIVAGHSKLNSQIRAFNAHRAKAMQQWRGTKAHFMKREAAINASIKAHKANFAKREKASRMSIYKYKMRTMSAINKQRHALKRLQRSTGKAAVSSAPSSGAAGTTIKQVTVVNAHDH